MPAFPPPCRHRIFCLGLLFVAGLAAGIHPAPAAENSARPVSVQELSLLLRSGYTGEETLRETAGRPLLAPLTAADERALLDAGADPRTIAALKTGRPIVSESEAENARRLQAAAEQHRLDAWAALQERQLAANRQAVQEKLDARQRDSQGKVAGLLQDKLVFFKDGRVQPYDNASLTGKRFFLLYASASWCGPCRKLTPQLVKFYREFAPKHPEFELILIGEDRSAADMANYMKTEAMPWAALAWERKAQEPGLAALAKDGIPRLVLIDGTGTLLADNFDNGRFVDAHHVLDALVAKTDPAATAAAR